MKMYAVVLTGSLALTGCAEARGNGESAPVEAAAEPCYSLSEVAQLPFDWQTGVIAVRDAPGGQALKEGAEYFAQKTKDMSWSVPEGSDCIGYRESLVLTKEALILSDALANDKATDTEFDNVAAAGDEFMQVMKMEENGYSNIQISFPTNADEARELIPGS